MIGHVANLIEATGCLLDSEMMFLDIARELVDCHHTVELATVDGDMFDVGISLSGSEDAIAEYEEVFRIDPIVRCDTIHHFLNTRDFCSVFEH